MAKSQSKCRQASVGESLLRSEESHFGDVLAPKDCARTIREPFILSLLHTRNGSETILPCL